MSLVPAISEASRPAPIFPDSQPDRLSGQADHALRLPAAVGFFILAEPITPCCLKRRNRLPPGCIFLVGDPASALCVDYRHHPGAGPDGYSCPEHGLRPGEDRMAWAFRLAVPALHVGGAAFASVAGMGWRF